jgi:mannose-6-phosphate isomerase-like protein (cupin superfamily)
MPIAKPNGASPIPEWSDIIYHGVNVREPGDDLEPHYHDANEYWFIISGTGTCITEGDTYEIGPGDMVLTRAGDEHSLVVHERMVAAYAYGPLKPGGRFGHLHRQ